MQTSFLTRSDVMQYNYGKSIQLKTKEGGKVYFQENSSPSLLIHRNTQRDASACFFHEWKPLRNNVFTTPSSKSHIPEFSISNDIVQSINYCGYVIDQPDMAVIGSSEIGIAHITDEMGPCLGIGMGIKKGNTVLETGVLHLSPDNSLDQLKTLTKSIQDDSEAKASCGLQGGTSYDGRPKQYEHVIKSVRLIEDAGIDIEFDHTGTKRKDVQDTEGLRQTAIGAIKTSENSYSLLEQISLSRQTWDELRKDRYL